MPEPTDIDNFNAKLLDAQRRSYDCLDYDDQQCRGKLVLLAWVGGKRFEDAPKCTIRTHDTWWFWLAARSDEPRLTALKFSVECKKRCTCFADSRPKHRWDGVLPIPVFYGKKTANNVAFDRKSIRKESKTKSSQEMLCSHVKLVLLGQTTQQETSLTCSVHVE